MSQEPIARDLQPGETVSITIPKAVVRFTEDGQLFVDTPDGAMYMVPLHDGLKVEREIPAQGKPMRGEQWADRHGNVYYAVGNLVGGEATKFMDSGGNSEYWTSVNELGGPLRRISEAVTFTADELAGIADSGEPS